MGDMAELLEWQHDREYGSLVSRYGPGLWATKDDNTLKISEMGRIHIENTIRYISKNRSFLNIELDGVLLRDAKLDELVQELVQELERRARINE